MNTTNIIFFIRNYILRNAEILSKLIENILAYPVVAKANIHSSIGQTNNTIVVSIRKSNKKEIISTLRSIVEHTVDDFHNDIQNIINCNLPSTIERIYCLSHYREYLPLAMDVIEANQCTYVISI